MDRRWRAVAVSLSLRFARTFGDVRPAKKPARQQREPKKIEMKNKKEFQVERRRAGQSPAQLAIILRVDSNRFQEPPVPEQKHQEQEEEEEEEEEEEDPINLAKVTAV